MSKHPIVHIEFSADDPAATAKFYEKLFGWKTEHDAQLNYTMFEAEGGPGGGFNPTSQDMVNPGDIFIYVATDDIEATLAKVKALGGQTLMPKSEIPGVGWFGFFTDPTGNRVGLYTGMSEQG